MVKQNMTFFFFSSLLFRYSFKNVNHLTRNERKQEKKLRWGKENFITNTNDRWMLMKHGKEIVFLRHIRMQWKTLIPMLVFVNFSSKHFLFWQCLHFFLLTRAASSLTPVISLTITSEKNEYDHVCFLYTSLPLVFFLLPLCSVWMWLWMCRKNERKFQLTTNNHRVQEKKKNNSNASTHYKFECKERKLFS